MCDKHWNDCRSVVGKRCVEKCYCEWIKKAQCTVHSGPNKNLTHFRGFHHKSHSSSNNHFLLLCSYSEVLFFFLTSVVALHLYRYCLDQKEKRKKNLCYFLVWSVGLCSRSTNNLIDVLSCLDESQSGCILMWSVLYIQ